MMRKLSLCLACVLCLLISTALLYGQGTTGAATVTGRVTDTSGAVIGGVDVKLTDLTTNTSQTTQSNAAGLYIFNNVVAGRYDITVSKTGFSKAEVKQQEVLVGTATTVDIILEVGQITEVVEVKTVAGAELQTLNATMGSTITNEGMMELPFINRDASGLMFLQPTAAPTFGGASGNESSGQIAGNMSDQNTYLLDGGNATSDLDGDNGTYVGSRSAVIPTPVESIEEVRVNTNNMTSDFGLSNGGQMLMNTKRGTNQFHGSAYDFFQSDVLSSNDWYNNFHDLGKPKSHYNKFGGAFGGPVLPSFLGGKTYIYSNYEGERYPRSGPAEKIVPNQTFREGIIQQRDANGNIVQYNLATSTLCGATGGQPCDPRGLGISPVVSQMWSKYMPACNDLSAGDQNLNTCGYIANLSYPLSNDFGVVRVDHDFGTKWRWFSSYRYFRQENPDTNQVDWGGLLPGDTLGKPASASATPVNPRYLVTGITGTITPNLTNEFHFSYTRNQWQWLRSGAQPQLPGIDGAVGIGGESGSALIPININTQQARNRLWDGHDYSYRDTLSWLKGTHLWQFGGEFFHQHWKFDRYDNVVGGLTQLVDDVSNSGVNFSPAYQPIPCTSSVVTNCLPAAQIPTWNGLYAELAGIVDSTSVVVSRTGSNLTANPLGTPVHSFVTDQTYSLFFNDSWKIKPNITISYGLNYTIQMPPYELNGAQDVLTTNGAQLTVNNYLQSVQNAAANGQVYNPVLGFTPVRDVSPGNKYVYRPFYGGLAPRVAVAWNPEVKGGFLGTILGDKSTVFRAGYGRSFSRSLGIGLVSTPVLGDGFLQPVGCKDPNMSGVCTGPGQVTPANAFRIGVDGLNPPVGAITPTLPVPVTPGYNAPYAGFVESLDQNWKPSRTDTVDVSIQRQLKGNMILEVGYVGVWAANLYQGIDLGNVPYMLKQGGQSFAQAYDNLYFALAAGSKNFAPQPFLETALKGSSYCSGYASCTAAVANKESGNILTQSVTNMWSDLDTQWTAFPPALASTTQCTYCYAYTSDGYSNYQAMVVTLQKRYSAGLTVNANFTYSHALGIVSTGQAQVLDNASNAFNLYSDYGPQFFDRKYTFNLLSSYQLPFGKGKRWGNNANPVLSRIISGWTVSPIFSAASGLPLQIFTGSYQEQGNAFDGNISATAIPVGIQASSLSVAARQGVSATGTVGVNGNAANGGAGANLFSNPAAVYAEFRPFLLGIDQRTGGAGILRGMSRYNLDLGVTKDTRFTERIGAQLFVQAFNVMNHMQFADGSEPFSTSLNLQNPASFGVLGTGSAPQYNPLTLGGAGASANYTRIIQIGLRVYF